MIEYVSEDGTVWMHEQDAIRYGQVYRTKRIAGEGPRVARENRQPSQEPEAEDGAEELLRKSSPPKQKEGKRDWAERLNKNAPMTTDPELLEKAARGFNEPKDKAE